MTFNFVSFLWNCHSRLFNMANHHLRQMCFIVSIMKWILIRTQAVSLRNQIKLMKVNRGKKFKRGISLLLPDFYGSMSFFILLCDVHLCVWVCGNVYIWVCVLMCTCGWRPEILCDFLCHCSSSFWGQALLLNLDLAEFASHQASGIFVFLPPPHQNYRHMHCTWFSCGCWESELRSLWLHWKHIVCSLPRPLHFLCCCLPRTPQRNRTKRMCEMLHTFKI